MDYSIKGEIARRNLKYKDVAAKVKISETSFYRKCKNNSFSLAEATRILDVLGMKMVFVNK